MPAQTTPGLPDPVATVRFATALAKAPSLAELERVFTAGFGRVVGVPMYGFYALEPGQPRIERNVAVNVSDVFVARYDRVMESDPLLERSRSTGRTAYNLAIMSAAEWEQSAGGTLHAHAERMPDGALVTVLELRGEQPGLAGRFLRSLTPREAEVAGLVVEGLTDREIARRLLLSPYTVMQHVKSVYRKLGVDSRVALTRLLTGASPGSGMR